MKMQQHEEDGKSYHGATGGIIWTPDIADEVFETWDYGHAFAYLYRRFGPSQSGCDPHKTLSCYLLTTGMRGVLLSVRPATSAGTSFGYLLSGLVHNKLNLEDIHAKWRKWKGKDSRTSRADRIKLALKRAMEELKRPTNVRDWMINIQGECDDFSPRSVEPSKLAGYGITPDYFDKFKDGR